MPDGSLLPVRCGAPNRCRYCSWLAALENALVVAMDAETELPGIGFTLTTKAARTLPARFRKDVEQAFRALRRRWPDAQYLGQVEFTTGEGTRSGGHRRIHQHGLLKGVPRAEVRDVEEVLRRVWKERTGATRVEAHELHRPAGAIAYLVNHHQKTAQAPPKGWSGKRFRPSKGYFTEPVALLRELARERLADDVVAAQVGKLLEDENAWDDGPLIFGPGEVEEYDRRHDELLASIRDRPAPTLVRVARLPTDWDDDGMPKAFEVTALEPLHAGNVNPPASGDPTG